MTDSLPPNIDVSAREQQLKIVEVDVDVDARIRRLKIDDERHRTALHRERTEIQLRRVFALAIGILFVLLNIFVCSLILYALSLDQVLLSRPESFEGEPRVTSNVLVALLGGTALQVGAALVVVARYLFPTRDLPAKKPGDHQPT